VRFAFRLSLLLLLLAIPQFGQVPSLASVKKIKIGSMGQSDEAERFRLLLDNELNKVGFITTEDSASADAVLTGVLSVRVEADESRARVTVLLKTPDGQRLWGKDFEPHLKLGAKDTVKLRAEDVAKALQKDARKSH
jgi:hypothetical protein